MSNLEIFDCLFTNNRLDGLDTYGGGVAFSYCNMVVLSNTEISINYASHQGGGLYGYYIPSFMLADMVFSNNICGTTNNDESEGGGAVCFNGSYGLINISNVTFTRNESDYGSSIKINLNNELVLSSSSFIDNYGQIVGANTNAANTLRYYSGTSLRTVISNCTFQDLSTGGSSYLFWMYISSFSSVTGSGLDFIDNTIATNRYYAVYGGNSISATSYDAFIALSLGGTISGNTALSN